MKITINVTQEDIDQGKRGSDLFCPIALACKKSGQFEVYNNRIAIGDNYISTYDRDNILDGNFIDFKKRVELPPNAKLFIRSFDRQYKVYPFSFEIERYW